uniref:Protein-tyrosine phosphatase n=1 Tax=Strongyloides venezuelensis TaxID=75913 RepID=A0A0K0G3V1_STRVS
MIPLNNQVPDNNFGDVVSQAPLGATPVDQLKGNHSTKNYKTSMMNPVKRNKKRSVDIKKTDNSKQRSQLLDAFSWSVLDKEIGGLKKEYKEDVAKIIPKKEECVAFHSREVAEKNRNPYVPCLDLSRCPILTVPPSESYIHANYISSVNSSKRYIATQAPLDGTVVDFWRLIIQEKTDHIVMLCNFREKNVSKCAEYFPVEYDKLKSIGEFKITLTKKFHVRADESITCYSLNVSNLNGDHSVKVFHWTNWPETGHPPITGTALTLYAGVYTSNHPIVVHCSSGVRRTGIWLMVALFMDVINEGKIENDSILKLSKKLRKQRAGAIVNDVDYVFIHRLIFQQLINKQIIASSQRLLEFFDDYEMASKKADKLEKANNQKMTIENDDINQKPPNMPVAPPPINF